MCQDEYICSRLESGESRLNLCKSGVLCVRLAGVLLLAFVVILLVSCGADDDDRLTAEEQQAVLESIVLSEAELPDGLIEFGRSFSDNGQAADDATSLQRFESWGRQLGLRVDYIIGPEAPTPREILAVRSDATLYASDRGGQLSYQYDVDRSRDADWAAASPGMTDIQVEELDASELGDQGYWLRVSGLSVDEPQTLMIVDRLVLRTGRLRTFIQVESRFLPQTPRNVAENLVRTWADIVAGRMEDAPID